MRNLHFRLYAETLFIDYRVNLVSMTPERKLLFDVPPDIAGWLYENPSCDIFAMCLVIILLCACLSVCKMVVVVCFLLFLLLIDCVLMLDAPQCHIDWKNI